VDRGRGFVDGCTQDRESLARSFAGKEFVFHLAAKGDVRRGTDHPGKDLEQNTIVLCFQHRPPLRHTNPVTLGCYAKVHYGVIVNGGAFIVAS
jgi:hypothetical protein